MSATAEMLVQRFYDELWNQWRLEAVDEIVADDVQFRGSLGSHARGRPALREYVERVRDAFPDWHNQVDELFSAGERVTARLTWTGTHLGRFAGLAPSGRRVEYVGVGLFTVRDDRIATAWIVGDTQELWRSLGLFDPPTGR